MVRIPTVLLLLRYCVLELQWQLSLASQVVATDGVQTSGECLLQKEVKSTRKLESDQVSQAVRSRSANATFSSVAAVSLLDTVMDPKNLNSEDKGMTATSLMFVGLPVHFWSMMCCVGVILVVSFLARVQMNDCGEDMPIHQALPIASLWAFLGIALILFNKFLFLPDGFGFGFPYAIFLMWWHALVGTIATNILRLARPDLLPAVSGSKIDMKSYFINIFPIAGLQAFALALGNTAYLYISVSYIQMVKNTTSAIVFIFSIMMGLEKGTISSSMAVALVVVGLLLTTVGEMEFSLLGFFFQMGGTLCDSLRLCLTKVVMSSSHGVRLDPMSTLYFSSPTMLVMLTVPMYLVDRPSLTMDRLLEMKFVLLTNAMLAFGLNMTSMFFMKRCGATTYALTGVLKDIGLIVLCTVLYGHPVTLVQFIGFVVSLAGFQVYNSLKTDPSYLVRIWYSLRGVEFNDPESSQSLKTETCPEVDSPKQYPTQSPQVFWSEDDFKKGLHMPSASGAEPSGGAAASCLQSPKNADTA